MAVPTEKLVSLSFPLPSAQLRLVLAHETFKGFRTVEVDWFVRCARTS
jgi:hypothetical protein